MKHPFLFLPALMIAATSLAQSPDTTAFEGALPGVRIEALRTTETAASAPFALSVLQRPPAEAVLDPATSLQTVLRSLPGLWVNDRSHFALGERLSIRGLGSRAAFGVRGVQVLLDGIPLTMPDGQSILDIVDPASISRAELIRGPSSTFWGNGSGGTLFLFTDAPSEGTAARLRALGGADGQRQFAGTASAPLGKSRLQATVSDTRQDGYRRYSEGRFTRAALHGDVDLGAASRLRFNAALADQDTQNPGALTADQVREDPRLADARNVNTSAGKESFQFQGGATLLHTTPAGLLTATAYGIRRSLDNPLAFAYIDLERAAGGARLALQNERNPVHWGLAADAGFQRDDRLNFDNDGGAPGEERGLDQVETVQNLAASAHASFPLVDALRLSVGLRADHIRFEMDDKLLDNGDQSGQRTFSAFSPAVGLSYPVAGALLFVNYSTSFETPTTTELVNNPDLTGGFNPDVDAQRVRGLEAGARGALAGPALGFDVAVFHLKIDDRLVSFQTEEGGGRTFFRNGGENAHTGVEMTLTWQPAPGLLLDAAYTGSRFVFEEPDLADNRAPGVPPHRFYGALRYERDGWWGRFAVEAVDTYFVDDANTARNDGYVVADLNVGHTGLPVGAARLQPFFKVLNLFDAAYNGSVIVNASGGRYYEPAPGRMLQAGLALSLDSR